MEQFDALNDHLKTATYKFQHDENHRRATPAPLAIADGEIPEERPREDLAKDMTKWYELCQEMVDSAHIAYQKTTVTYKSLTAQPDSFGKKMLLNQMEERCLSIMSFLHSVSYSC